MTDRWQRVLDQKPVALLDHLLKEAAALMAADLGRWPPQIESLDPASAGTYQQALEDDRPRPSPIVYREALRLARWDLEREHLAYDDYIRNRRWTEAGLTEDDRPTLLMLSRLIVEQLLAFGEATQARVKRRHLILCLDQLERDLLARVTRVDQT